MRASSSSAREARPRLATPRGQASQETIVRVAIELLGRGGYGALTVDAVCKAAQVAPTSLYWHFKDKAGLMEALVRHVQRLDAETYLQSLGKAKTFDGKLDASVDMLRTMILRDPFNVWVVTSSLWEGRHASPEIAPIVIESRRRQVEFLRKVGSEYFGLADSETLAYTSAAFSTFAALSYHQARNEEELEASLQAMRHMWQLAATWITLPRRARKQVTALPSIAHLSMDNLLEGLP